MTSFEGSSSFARRLRGGIMRQRFANQAHLSPQINVGSYDSLLRHARRFLAGGGDSFRPQNDLRFSQVAVGFRQRAFAIHHSRIGAVTEFLNDFWINLHGWHWLKGTKATPLQREIDRTADPSPF